MIGKFLKIIILINKIDLLNLKIKMLLGLKSH
jgi:hypothetical protein